MYAKKIMKVMNKGTTISNNKLHDPLVGIVGCIALIDPNLID
jgi:hypothetical protein